MHAHPYAHISYFAYFKNKHQNLKLLRVSLDYVETSRSKLVFMFDFPSLNNVPL